MFFVTSAIAGVIIQVVANQTWLEQEKRLFKRGGNPQEPPKVGLNTPAQPASEMSLTFGKDGMKKIAEYM